jgi:RNA polymerase sigma-70 factor (ECF subfamily)
MEGAVERELVLAARMGDEAAFARLIEAEAPRIYRAVLAVVQSPEDAQEVIQDASIRAWQQLGGLREVDKWPAWFRRIAVRQAIDRAGRQGRKRLHEIDLASMGVEPARGPSSGWADRVAVMSALRQLPADDRVLLGLRFGADLEGRFVRSTTRALRSSIRSRPRNGASESAASTIRMGT